MKTGNNQLQRRPLVTVERPAWYLFGALLLLTGWRSGWLGGGAEPSQSDFVRPVAQRGALNSQELDTIALFRRCSPAVVHISTLREGIQRSFFGRGRKVEMPAGTGSGIVWDEEGHIVTNDHVVNTADRAIVRLADHSTWEAKLVGRAPNYDMAVLKIDAPAKHLAPIPLGTSTDLQVGQSVLAIGNPFGLDQTLTTGVISGLEREIRSQGQRQIEGVIQTDAAINPGNSGGALLDSAGRLIGMNTAIYSPSGSSAGVGFAVPVDSIHRIVPELLRHGRVRRPGFGIRIAQDNDTRGLGIRSGVLVLDVVEGSVADRAGLNEALVDDRGALVQGDVILQVGEYPVRSVNELHLALAKHEVGEEVTLVLERYKSERRRREELRVKLQALDR